MGITATEILSRAALARRIGASTAAEPAAAAVEINCLLVNAMMRRLRLRFTVGFRPNYWAVGKAESSSRQLWRIVTWRRA